MKRQFNTNEFISPSSFDSIDHQKAFNQNRSFSPIDFNHQLDKKSKHSFSCTSFKEYNLSKRDFVELRQALQRISHYLQPKIECSHKRRLTSPYLQQQQLIGNDRSLLPLYTNEYFIRNGLLNHNDGPEIYDDIFSSGNLCRSILRLRSCSPSVPLTLLPNQKHLFTALTSNFASEQPPRCSQSTIGLIEFKCQENDDDHGIETQSMRIRRNKVQIWERDNILQRKMSIAQSFIEADDQMNVSEYHRSSLMRTSSSNNDEKSATITAPLIAEINSSFEMCDKGEENDKLVNIQNADDFFPMVKKLAPYIIIRNSIHRHSSEKKSFQHSDHLRTVSEKRSSSTVQKTNRVHQRKKNYLLTEFESVLTTISK